MQEPYPIPPFTQAARGSVRVPGSKSITNRALILAALSEGETVLQNCLFSQDTEIMIEALRALGFSVRSDPSRRSIAVAGESGNIPNKEAKIFVGNSGTSARFLTAFLCLAKDGDYQIDGVPQMRKRPMADLLDALVEIGADIESASGFAPLRIRAKGLVGGKVSIDASASSQFVSALELVAPFTQKGLSIHLSDPSVRRSYIELTLEMLKQFGLPAESIATSANDYSISRAAEPLRASGSRYRVEGDASAASYFFALPLAVTGEVEIRGLAKDSLQGDIAFTKRVEEAGGYIEWSQESAIVRYEPGAKPEAVQGSFYPYSDTFLSAAAIAPLLDGTSHISGIEHTRHQECDRVSAVAQGLIGAGQRVSETSGSLKIEPRPLKAVTIETYDDHRVAMSFAILGCHDARGDGQAWLRIENPLCCEKTFPSFFTELESLRQQSLQR